MNLIERRALKEHLDYAIHLVPQGFFYKRAQLRIIPF